jgi:hypothetical protein
MISEASVHGHLALLLWACGGTVDHGGSTWQRWPFHLMVAKQRTELERAWGSNIPFMALPQIT